MITRVVVTAVLVVALSSCAHMNVMTCGGRLRLGMGTDEALFLCGKPSQIQSHPDGWAQWLYDGGTLAVVLGQGEVGWVQFQNGKVNGWSEGE